MLVEEWFCQWGLIVIKMGIAKFNCVWVGEGVCGTSGCIMMQYKRNANMPSYNLCCCDCFEYGMMCTRPINEAGTYNFALSCRGFEAFQGAGHVRYCVSDTSCLCGCLCQCIQWIHCDGSVMWTSASKHLVNMAAPGVGYWSYQYWFYFLQIGTNGWEIDVDGNYCLRQCITCISGDDVSIPTNACTITVEYAPTAPSTGSYRGAIWVEGNDLHFRPEQTAETWEHAMQGNCQGTGGTAGAIWIDNNHYLNWVNSSGDIYKAKWRICQFCSWFSNSSGPNPSPGASYAGAIWADGEFGYSHLAYIGCDGNKYITGAGEYPYTP